jgi:hypothetical protein
VKTAAALFLGGAGILLGAYGILLWIAIPRSDTTTSSLFLTGLLLVVGGLVLVAAALAVLRLGTRPRKP